MGGQHTTIASSTTKSETDRLDTYILLDTLLEGQKLLRADVSLYVLEVTGNTFAIGGALQILGSERGTLPVRSMSKPTSVSSTAACEDALLRLVSSFLTQRRNESGSPDEPNRSTSSSRPDLHAEIRTN